MNAPSGPIQPPFPPPTPEPHEEDTFTFIGLGRAIRRVTPTLLVVGAATGFAFAIGTGLGQVLLQRLVDDKK